MWKNQHKTTQKDFYRIKNLSEHLFYEKKILVFLYFLYFFQFSVDYGFR